jgi:hypothetical protein
MRTFAVERLLLLEANPTSCVFQNIDPPHPPLRPASVYPPPLLQVEDTLARGRGGWGGGVNILEDARHSPVLYLYRILFDFCFPLYLPLWYEDSPTTWAWTCCSAAARASLHLIFLAHLRQAEHVFVNVYGAQESFSKNRFSQPCSLAGRYAK